MVLLWPIGLAVFVAPFASSWPDGLEHVAEKLGFVEKAVVARWPPVRGLRHARRFVGGGSDRTGRNGGRVGGVCSGTAVARTIARAKIVLGAHTARRKTMSWLSHHHGPEFDPPRSGGAQTRRGLGHHSYHGRDPDAALMLVLAVVIFSAAWRW